MWVMKQEGAARLQTVVNKKKKQTSNSQNSLFFLLCAVAGELWEPADASSSSLGSFFTSGFLSSSAVVDEDAEDDTAVSIGSALQPSPEGFSCFI